MGLVPPTLPLSVVIITRDEADRLPGAMRSVSFAEEIVVLDSGSTDGTVEVARGLGARVEQGDWPGHVAQKNRALALARCPWVLSLDADERVSGELAAGIAAVIAADGPVDGYRVGRLNHWGGAPMRHGTWYPDRRVRLVRSGRGRFTGRDPHDLLAVDGPVADLPGDLLHDPYRDLGEHLATIDRYSARFAEQAAADGVRASVMDVLLRPPAHLIRALILRVGVLDGVRGLCVAWLGAAYVALKWTRLWLAGRGRRP